MENITHIGDITKPITKTYSCFGCKGEVHIHLDKELLNKIVNRGPTSIQRVFPSNASDREFFITGMCPNCQDEMYNNLREFEDEDYNQFVQTIL